MLVTNRKISRLLVVVWSIALLFIIHYHIVSIPPNRFRDSIQATLSSIKLPFQRPPLPPPLPPPTREPTEDAFNSTLGFEKVFYISMPFRTDRQDAMNLIAHSTHINLTYEPGVNGREMHPNARPESSGSLRPGQLGCWRAHANVWSRVLRENIASALILEDDADWDVNVHDSFALVGRHMRGSNTLRGRDLTEYEREAAPYGLDWDILYVGHCWDNRNDSDSANIHFDDPNAPSGPEMSQSYRNEIESYGYNVTEDTRHRLITHTGFPVCTIAYAVTQKGAEKLLYNIGGYKGVDKPVDLALAGTVEDGLTTAVTVLPPLIVDFSLDAKSDINLIQPVEEPIGPLHGKSNNLRKSARTALGHLGVSTKFPPEGDPEAGGLPDEEKHGEDHYKEEEEGEEEYNQEDGEEDEERDEEYEEMLE